MARPHIEPYVELNHPFKKFDLSGFKGSHYKVLSLDADTGACTLKVRFDGGFRRKPGLCYSDMEIFVLTGTLRVARRTGLKAITLSFRPVWPSVPSSRRRAPKCC